MMYDRVQKIPMTAGVIATVAVGEKVGEINGNIETKSNGVNGHAKH